MGLGMDDLRLTRTEETSVEVAVFSVVSDGSQQLLSLSLTPLNMTRLLPAPPPPTPRASSDFRLLLGRLPLSIDDLAVANLFSIFA